MLGRVKAHRSKPAACRLRDAGVRPNGPGGMEVPVTAYFTVSRGIDAIGACAICGNVWLVVSAT